MRYPYVRTAVLLAAALFSMAVFAADPPKAPQAAQAQPGPVAPEPAQNAVPAPEKQQKWAILAESFYRVHPCMFEAAQAALQVGVTARDKVVTHMIRTCGNALYGALTLVGVSSDEAVVMVNDIAAHDLDSLIRAMNATPPAPPAAKKEEPAAEPAAEAAPPVQPQPPAAQKPPAARKK